MTAIAEVMVEMKLVTTSDDVLKLNLADSSGHFDQAIVFWMEHLRARSTQQRGRWMELSIPTLYELKQKCKKRAREQLEAAAAMQIE